MTTNQYVGQRTRHTALRKRQQAFLAALVDSCGSRVRAVESSGVPLGTVLRWQSDPWFAKRYAEIRETLSRDAERLRVSLMAASVAMVLGEYRGLAKAAAVRRIIDALDERETRTDASAALDAQIRELLDG